MSEEREKLAELLWSRIVPFPAYTWEGATEYRKEEMRIHADFVIEDRRRIVEPLFQSLNGIRENENSIYFPCLVKAAKETLKNAGVEL